MEPHAPHDPPPCSLVVVDIGNSRMKWGRCSATRVEADVSLPNNDPIAWTRQIADWNLQDESWLVAGVVPRARDQFADFLHARGKSVRVIDSHRQIPIKVAVDHPERVGLDRLFNAVAARTKGAPAILVDAGSAVTVDRLDSHGAFCGGAIFPGLRLMARSLNTDTAQLPLVEITTRVPPPGRSTVAAIETGVFHAVVGGIDRLCDDLEADAPVWFTGGDAPLLLPHLRRRATLWKEMTLEGIRLC